MATIESAIESPLGKADERPGESKGRRRACAMTDGLYVKANGELPCWCHQGEQKILDTLDADWLKDPGHDLVDHGPLRVIRESFLEGELPFPEFCASCRALDDGWVEPGRPTHLDRLMVEPSYLCGLDCPGCVVRSTRMQIKAPPHIMPYEFFEALVLRLKADGIETIREVHFEGRGEPLMNKDMERMVRVVKDHYPESTTIITTHGSLALRKDLLTCGLDILRFSVDGVDQESYEQFRRFGKLDRALSFMRGLRDHRRSTGSQLQVVWKYILFEWNDSDEDLKEVVRLADELEVGLLFVLTDEPAPSKRFATSFEFAEYLETLCPRADIENCTDFRPAHGLLASKAERKDLASEWFGQVPSLIETGQLQEAATAMAKGLSHDPGLDDDRLEAQLTTEDPFPESLLGDVLSLSRSPATLRALGHAALSLERPAMAYELFLRYLTIGPEATDRGVIEKLLIGLALESTLGTSDPAHFFTLGVDNLTRAENAILRIDPGHRPLGLAEAAAEPADLLAWVQHQETLRSLAYLRWAGQDPAAARAFFEAFLARNPASVEAQPVQWALEQIDASSAESVPDEAPPNAGLGGLLRRLTAGIGRSSAER